MFWFKHPKPLISQRAVATQVVQSAARAAASTEVIIVEKIPAASNEPTKPV